MPQSSGAATTKKRRPRSGAVLYKVQKKKKDLGSSDDDSSIIAKSTSQHTKKPHGDSDDEEDEEYSRSSASQGSSVSLYTLSVCSEDKENFELPQEQQKDGVLLAFVKKFQKTPIRAALDLSPYFLFFTSLTLHFTHLDKPRAVVFDELKYGRMISMYYNNTFFFDAEPPLGKIFLTMWAYVAGYDGKYGFHKIGAEYSNIFPIWYMRAFPAFWGSTIPTFGYDLLRQVGCRRGFSLLGGLFLLFDNALLVQTKFMFVDGFFLPVLMVCVLSSIKFAQFHRRNRENWFKFRWWLFLSAASLSSGFVISTRSMGWMTLFFVQGMLLREVWLAFPQFRFTMKTFGKHLLSLWMCMVVVPLVIYVVVFRLHLDLLYKAGPNDDIMSSMFQTSLQGGLSTVVQGQPTEVADGSQITLRHTHMLPTCFLHSHTDLYPVRYADARGSSHQQQVTCHPGKDVNNWWIVKYPNSLSQGASREFIRPIRHGDVIHLIHGVTNNLLNSHDVAAPLTKSCQEVTCYVNHNVGEAPQDLWRVEVMNKETAGFVWKAIESEVRLIHVDTGTALKVSGLHLPDWGYEQLEVVTDRVVNQVATIWNVEEHRYSWAMPGASSSRDQTEPLYLDTGHKLGFWAKFWELQSKMLFAHVDRNWDHKYSSQPLDWPFMTRNVAYWMDSNSLAQIHHMGNLCLWYCGSYFLGLYVVIMIYYMVKLRYNRIIEDQVLLAEWMLFCRIGYVFLVAYFVHYLPCFLYTRTLFLYHYMPALIFKLLLMAAVLDHFHTMFERLNFALWIIPGLSGAIFACGLIFFFKMMPLTYVDVSLTPEKIQDLQWQDTWDFIKVQNRYFFRGAQDVNPDQG